MNKQVSRITGIIVLSFGLVSCGGLVRYSSGSGGAKLVWQKTYYGKGYASAGSIQQTTDGGYIFVGSTSNWGSGEKDAWIIKLDPEGKIVWQKNYGGKGYDSAGSIQQTTDGGYILAGTTKSYAVGKFDAWVVKLDSAGNVSWQKTYGGKGYDFSNSIQQTTDGGYILAGTTDSYGAGKEDAWVVKLDSVGNVSWQKTYGGKKDDSPRSIQQTTDGGYILAGGSGFNGAGWVVKFDSVGNISGQKNYGGKGGAATSIQQTTDGGYIVVGYNSLFESDALVVKYNSALEYKWSKELGGSEDDKLYSIQQTVDGGYIMAGQTKSYGAGKGDAWIVKLGPDGNK